MDEDGYPTEETLERVRTWPINSGKDVTEAFAFIRDHWNYRDHFIRKRNRVRRWKGDILHRAYEVHTVGWSGNESLIGAMEDNLMLWMLTWQRIERGGHYLFLVAEDW